MVLGNGSYLIVRMFNRQDDLYSDYETTNSFQDKTLNTVMLNEYNFIPSIDIRWSNTKDSLIKKFYGKLGTMRGALNMLKLLKI